MEGESESKSKRGTATKAVWQQREHDADLQLKRCYTWVSQDPNEKPLLLGTFTGLWSAVRQKARAGKGGYATDDEFIELYDAAIKETSEKLAQIPPESDLVSRYAIAYKWAEHPDGFPRFSETDFSFYNDLNKRNDFTTKLDILEKIAAEKLATGQSKL